MKRVAIAAGAALAAFLFVPTAHADEWDESIKKAKTQESSAETDEERERRRAKEEREHPVEPRHRLFLLGGIGLLHGGEITDPLCTPSCTVYTPIASVAPTLTLGGSAVFGLSETLAFQTRAAFLLGPSVSEEVSYDDRSLGRRRLDKSSSILAGGSADATLRVLLGPALFVGGGLFLSAVAKTGAGFGGFLSAGIVGELGLRFGELRQFEVALRPAIGGGDVGLYGQHFVTFGWSLVGFGR